MSNLVFHYFDGRARGELSRLVLAQAGVSYTDHRIDFKEWFANPALKENSPLGQVPYLEVDNVKLPQSITIARYLARENNLVGQNSLEQAQADAIVDTVSDGYNAFAGKVVRNLVYGTQEEAAEGGKSFLADDFNKHFGNIEKLIQLYGQNGFSVGNGLTWADLAILDIQTKLLAFYGANMSLESFPNVQNVLKTVQAQPNVAQYLQTRPDQPV